MSSRPAPPGSARQEPAAGGMFVSHVPVRHLLLTSFDQDGAPLATAVRVVIDGERAYFRLSSGSAAAKRLRCSDWVQVAPCSALGFIRYGPLVNATARLLAGADADQAAARLARRYPAWRGLLTALAPRATRWRAVYYELRADPAASLAVRARPRAAQYRGTGGRPGRYRGPPRIRRIPDLVRALIT